MSPNVSIYFVTWHWCLRQFPNFVRNWSRNCIIDNWNLRLLQNPRRVLVLSDSSPAGDVAERSLSEWHFVNPRVLLWQTDWLRKLVKFDRIFEFQQANVILQIVSVELRMQIFILDVDCARADVESGSVVLADCNLKEPVVRNSFYWLDVFEKTGLSLKKNAPRSNLSKFESLRQIRRTFAGTQ